MSMRYSIWPKARRKAKGLHLCVPLLLFTLAGILAEEESTQGRLRGVVPGTKPWNINPTEIVDQQPQKLRWQEQRRPAGPKASGGKHICSSHITTLSDYQLEVVLRRRCRALCEQAPDGKDCEALLQPCMGMQRVRQQKRRSSMRAGLQSVDETEVRSISTVSFEEVIFVVFFAVGKRNAESFPSHQYVQPNLNFIPVLRITHPGSKIVMLSDEHTPFDPDMDVDQIYRFPIDNEKMGRNAYANFYQYLGQIEFLESLKANGSQSHVVFMDMDVLVLDSILELFCADYGYGLTINANEFDPVDIGVQFVQYTHYNEAIAWLKELTGRYLGLIGHPNSFTTGQVVMRNALEMGHMDVQIPRIAAAATRNNMHCKTVQGGKHRICFFPCLRYNYWEDCTANLGALLPQDPAKFQEHGVKIVQFVAWRKPGIDPVAKAFLEDGIEGAYRAFAELPHTEQGYNEKFNYNAEVGRICYHDDKGCFGTKLADEKKLWVCAKIRDDFAWCHDCRDHGVVPIPDCNHR